LASIKEVIILQVGNVQIEDIRWKLIDHLASVYPAKKNVILSTIPIIHRIVSLKESIKGYKEKKNG